MPLLAERAGPMTPWHPEHIAERYGEFTLIVLGESVLSTMVAAKASELSWASVVRRRRRDAAALRRLVDLLRPAGWLHHRRERAELLDLGLRPPADLRRGGRARGRASPSRRRSPTAAARSRPSGAAYCVAVPVAVYLLVLTELHERATDGFSMRARSLVKSVGVLVVAAAAIVGLAAADGAVDGPLLRGVAGRRRARRRSGRPLAAT